VKMKNNKNEKKRHAGRAIALILGFALAFMPIAAAGAAPPDYFTPNNPDLTTVQAAKRLRGTPAGYLKNWSCVPKLQTIVNPDGGISVLDTDNAVVYEYSANAEFVRAQTFKKELDKVGAFAKDKDDNYYIFYAKDVAESAYTQKNMVLVKYSPSGAKLNEFWIEAQTNDRFTSVKIPFDAGTCRMEISGDMIAVYFAREMFVAGDGINHQASYGFILDTGTFERLTGENAKKMPYVSHSFNQFILPVEGGFVFADQGDAYPRAFSFESVLQGQPCNRQIGSFIFEGRSGENYTGAEMGGLAKTPNGYIFAGTYDKKGSAAAGSRNLFLLVMDKELSAVSGPIWITDYTDKNAEHAVSPKIVQIDAARYLLLWEVYNPGGQNAEKVYMAVVNDKGEVITPPGEIRGVSLNGADVLRYNPKTKLAHWAAIGENGAVSLYSLDPLSDPHHAPPQPIGAKLGDVVYSDITAYINGHLIPTYAARGKTLVGVEDLARYGFDVVWNGTAKTLKVEPGKQKAFAPIMTADAAGKPGAFRAVYAYTGIKTYLSGKLTAGFSVNGQIVIDFETLKKYGKISWNGETRELRLVLGP